MGTRGVLSLIMCLPLAGCMSSTPNPPAGPTAAAIATVATTASVPTAEATPTTTPVTPKPDLTAEPTPRWSKLERAIRDNIS